MLYGFGRRAENVAAKGFVMIGGVINDFCNAGFVTGLVHQLLRDVRKRIKLDDLIREVPFFGIGLAGKQFDLPYDLLFLCIVDDHKSDTVAGYNMGFDVIHVSPVQDLFFVDPAFFKILQGKGKLFEFNRFAFNDLGHPEFDTLLLYLINQEQSPCLQDKYDQQYYEDGSSQDLRIIIPDKISNIQIK